ncbi:MAG: hypothetical protein ACE365_06405 [Gammaproteobacteria bacterium]
MLSDMRARRQKTSDDIKCFERIFAPLNMILEESKSEDFSEDCRDACIALGEIFSKVSAFSHDFRDANPTIPWTQIIAFQWFFKDIQPQDVLNYRDAFIDDLGKLRDDISDIFNKAHSQIDVYHAAIDSFEKFDGMLDDVEDMLRHVNGLQTALLLKEESTTGSLFEYVEEIKKSFAKFCLNYRDVRVRDQETHYFHELMEGVFDSNCIDPSFLDAYLPEDGHGFDWSDDHLVEVQDALNEYYQLLKLKLDRVKQRDLPGVVTDSIWPEKCPECLQSYQNIRDSLNHFLSDRNNNVREHLLDMVRQVFSQFDRSNPPMIFVLFLLRALEIIGESTKALAKLREGEFDVELAKAIKIARDSIVHCMDAPGGRKAFLDILDQPQLLMNCFTADGDLDNEGLRIFNKSMESFAKETTNDSIAITSTGMMIYLVRLSLDEKLISEPDNDFKLLAYQLLSVSLGQLVKSGVERDPACQPFLCDDINRETKYFLDTFRKYRNHFGHELGARYFENKLYFGVEELIDFFENDVVAFLPGLDRLHEIQSLDILSVNYSTLSIDTHKEFLAIDKEFNQNKSKMKKGKKTQGVITSALAALTQLLVFVQARDGGGEVSYGGMFQLVKSFLGMTDEEHDRCLELENVEGVRVPAQARVLEILENCKNNLYAVFLSLSYGARIAGLSEKHQEFSNHLDQLDAKNQDESSRRVSLETQRNALPNIQRMGDDFFYSFSGKMLRNSSDKHNQAIEERLKRESPCKKTPEEKRYARVSQTPYSYRWFMSSGSLSCTPGEETQDEKTSSGSCEDRNVYSTPPRSNKVRSIYSPDAFFDQFSDSGQYSPEKGSLWSDNSKDDENDLSPPSTPKRK